MRCITIEYSIREFGHLSGHAEVNTSTHDIFMCFPVTVRVSDISPIPLCIAGDQFNTFFHQCRKKIFCKIEIFTFRDIFKNLRLYNIDTSIDRITENFSPTRFLQEFFYCTFWIGNHYSKFQRIFNRSQRNGKFRFFFFVIIENLLKIKICHQVTTDNDKIVITDLLLCQFNCTGRTIVIVRNNISDIHTKFTSVTKIILDHFRLKIEKDNKIFDPQISEGYHCVFHHRTVHNR